MKTHEQLKFLIDTNIFIPVEPGGLSDIKESTPSIAKLTSSISEAGQQLFVHPASREDIRRDPDNNRCKLRELLFEKYAHLPQPPPITSKLAAILGDVEKGSNDWVDHNLIAALKADAVDFLLTEDREIRKKAARLSLQDRILTIAEATSTIRDLFDIAPIPPPAVRYIKAHLLNKNDPIFNSFREDYPNFDTWLRRCKLGHRSAWIIKGKNSLLAAICIVKQEELNEYNLMGKVLKICSFKVSEEYNGFRFGELLLKTVFDYCVSNKYNQMYVTVFSKYGNLVSLFEDFGFNDIGQKTNLGEIVLAKPISFTEEEYNSLSPLDFNIRYGPFAVKLIDVPSFVVPIKPKYHRLLFPEAEKQLDLLAGNNPFGNSIRKAYLSNTPIRTLKPGNNLFFYRSEDVKGITSLSVVEGTLVSSSPVEIARYVGKRTVYRFSEIEGLCRRGEVLAILFRESRILKKPISIKELKANKILSGIPQSITTISQNTLKWMERRINQ